LPADDICFTREAREQEARERLVISTAVPSRERSVLSLATLAAIVTNFDRPLADWLASVSKAALAAILTLVLLTVPLWLCGQDCRASFCSFRSSKF